MRPNSLFSRKLPRKTRAMIPCQAVAMRVALGGLALAGLLLAGRAYLGRPQHTNPLRPLNAPPPQIQGLVDDWTMRHLAYPETSDPTALSRLQQDPRWWFQQLKRHAGPAGSALNPAPATATTTSLLSNPLGSLVKGNAPTSKGNTKCKGPNCPTVDWGESLGISAGAFMGPGTYPAKFTFEINDTPDCLNDFVIL